MNTNGLNCDEIRVFLGILKKANDEQLAFAKSALENEISGREIEGFLVLAELKE